MPTEASEISIGRAPEEAFDPGNLGAPDEKTHEQDRPMGPPCPSCGKRWYRVETQEGEVVYAIITDTPCNRCRRAEQGPLFPVH